MVVASQAKVDGLFNIGGTTLKGNQYILDVEKALARNVQEAMLKLGGNIVLNLEQFAPNSSGALNSSFDVIGVKETKTGYRLEIKVGVGGGAIAWTGSGFTAGVTASYSGSNVGGGNWYTGSTHVLPVTASQLFSYHSNKDLNVDVKGIVSAWYSSSNAIGSANKNSK